MNIEKEKLQKIMLDLKRTGGFIKILADYKEMFEKINMLEQLENDLDYINSLIEEDKGGKNDKGNN